MRPVFLAVLAAVLVCSGCARAQTPAPNPTAFMAQNALSDGVQTLPSGVQYKIMRSGPAAGVRPTPQDMVTVNYEGKLLTGVVFDSSYTSGKPITFTLGDLIPGWIDALQQMRVGDEWTIWVPPSLGYGARQAGPIPPNSVLVFKLELLGIGPAAG